MMPNSQKKVMNPIEINEYRYNMEHPMQPFAVVHSNVPCTKSCCQYPMPAVPSHTTTCNSPGCTCQYSQTCISTYPIQIIPQTVHVTTTCNCSTHTQQYSVLHTPFLQSPRCCQTTSYQQRGGRMHLTSHNVTYPTPYYATSYAPFAGTHHSWEPTIGSHQTEYHLQNTSAEFHSHVHFHQRQRRTDCTTNDRGSGNANPQSGWYEPPSYTSPSLQAPGHHHRYLQPTRQSVQDTRFHRRQALRSSHQPYPTQMLHTPGYPTFSTVRAMPYFISLEAEPSDAWAQPSETKGLTVQQIDRLPSYVVTKEIAKEFSKDEKCVICMCEYAPEEKLRVLSCAHEFHLDCVDTWLKSNATCPICRSTAE